MITIPYTGDWQQITTASDAIIVGTSATARLFIGSVAPTSADAGFKIVDDYPYSIPNLNAFGGGAWVKGPADDVCSYVVNV